MKQERLKAICWKSSVTKQVHYHRDSNHLATQTANFNRSQKMQKKVYSRQKLGSADKDANDYDANDLCWFRIFFVSLPQKIKAIMRGICAPLMHRLLYIITDVIATRQKK